VFDELLKNRQDLFNGDFINLSLLALSELISRDLFTFTTMPGDTTSSMQREEFLHCYYEVFKQWDDPAYRLPTPEDTINIFRDYHNMQGTFTSGKKISLMHNIYGENIGFIVTSSVVEPGNTIMDKIRASILGVYPGTSFEPGFGSSVRSLSSGGFIFNDVGLISRKIYEPINDKYPILPKSIRRLMYDLVTTTMLTNHLNILYNKSVIADPSVSLIFWTIPKSQLYRLVRQSSLFNVLDEIPVNEEDTKAYIYQASLGDLTSIRNVIKSRQSRN
jgi:hypothetical protein